MASNDSPPPLSASAHVVRPIPFKAHRIAGFAPESLERYYERDHGGTIRSLNLVEVEISAAGAAKAAGSSPSALAPQRLRRAELMGRVALQELFLDGFGEDGGVALDDEALERVLIESFGTTEAWRREFIELAAIDGTCRGAVALVWSARFGRLLNVLLGEGREPLGVTVPILVLDIGAGIGAVAFEGDPRAYANAYVRSLHWGRIARRFRVARGADGGEIESAVEPGAEADAGQISVAELAGLMGEGEPSPLVLDVRHDDDRERYRSRIAGTQWRDSFRVEDWADDLPRDRPVVVYCMYGFWVSQQVAETLRAAGIDARSLAGGVTAWRAMGLPSVEPEP